MSPQLQTDSVEQTVAAAVKAHKARQWADAETLYRRALQARPHDPQLQYLLGALCFETKRAENARALLEAALQADPNHKPAQSMLGVVYAMQGQTEKALPYLRAAVSENPRSAEAHNHLGRALFEGRRFADAIQVYLASLALQPNQPETLTKLGASYQAANLHADAVPVFSGYIEKYPNMTAAYIALSRVLIEKSDTERAMKVLQACLEQQPASADALLLLGNIHYRRGRPDKAESFFQRLATIAPHDPVANSIHGAVLQALGRYEEALALSEKAVAVKPGDAEVLTAHGLILRNLGRNEEAVGVLRKAVQINASLAEAWNNLGMALQDGGEWGNALEHYDKAISLKPGFPLALTNKAHAFLALGRLGEAWPLYRHRFEKKGQSVHGEIYPYPQWDGKPDRSKTLLIWTDQGLGDEVLYSSMLADVADDVKRCIFACAPRMVGLFQRSFKNVDVVARTEPAHPEIEAAQPDAKISLAELGGFYRTDIASIPKQCGYLKPDALMRDTLRAKYEKLADGRRIVGVSWKSENPINGRYKSVALEEWRSVLECEGVLFVSLQYGDIEREVNAVDAGRGRIFVDDIDAVASPDACAAQIAAMDLVVTTSNTTAHFAGALNVPVWTLVPTGPGLLWYWFLGRDDSPWYPSMRLFRQHYAGQWRDVMTRVEQELRVWVAP